MATLKDLERKIVTLPVNGFWQPVYPQFQYQNQTADFWAYLCRYVVETRFGTTHHGEWADEAEARRFAASCDNGAVVREVEPYWYAPAFGVVS